MASEALAKINLTQTSKNMGPYWYTRAICMGRFKATVMDGQYHITIYIYILFLECNSLQGKVCSNLKKPMYACWE